jgi:hypothetical protein
MALDAAAGQVARMVVAEAGRLLVIGLVLGALLTLVAARWLAAFVYGVIATDPKTPWRPRAGSRSPPSARRCSRPARHPRRAERDLRQ